MSEDVFVCHSQLGLTGVQWVEARDAAKHSVMYRLLPQNSQKHTRIIWPRMSIVLRVRNPRLSKGFSKLVHFGLILLNRSVARGLNVCIFPHSVIFCAIRTLMMTTASCCYYWDFSRLLKASFCKFSCFCASYDNCWVLQCEMLSGMWKLDRWDPRAVFHQDRLQTLQTVTSVRLEMIS